MQAIEEGKFDRVKAAATVTSWGKKKGGLISQGMSDQADELASMVVNMQKVVAFVDAADSFDQLRDTGHANKCVVTFQNVDSQFKAKFIGDLRWLPNVAQAIVDGAGGDLASALSRLKSIDELERRSKELKVFFKNHYNRLLSRYESKGTEATVAAKEMARPLRPIMASMQASDRGDSELAKLTEGIPQNLYVQISVVSTLLEPNQADEDSLRQAQTLLSSDDPEEMDILRPFRVYNVGKAIIKTADDVLESFKQFDEPLTLYSALVVEILHVQSSFSASQEFVCYY